MHLIIKAIHHTALSAIMLWLKWSTLIYSVCLNKTAHAQKQCLNKHNYKRWKESHLAQSLVFQSKCSKSCIHSLRRTANNAAHVVSNAKPAALEPASCCMQVKSVDTPVTGPFSRLSICFSVSCFVFSLVDKGVRLDLHGLRTAHYDSYIHQTLQCTQASHATCLPRPRCSDVCRATLLLDMMVCADGNDLILTPYIIQIWFKWFKCKVSVTALCCFLKANTKSIVCNVAVCCRHACAWVTCAMLLLG